MGASPQILGKFSSGSPANSNFCNLQFRIWIIRWTSEGIKKWGDCRFGALLFRLLMFQPQYQKRIHNPVKHLKWGFRLGSEYVSEYTIAALVPGG